MEIRKLLYATDVMQPDFCQLERLLDLRKLGLEEVVCLHPNEFEDWERRLADYGIKSKTLVEEGPIVPRILSTAHQEVASLIAANLDRNANRLLGSSPSRNLLRSSPVPVIVLPENQISPTLTTGTFSHVIFAAEWSPASEKALRYLLNFKDIISELEVVNVLNQRLSVRELRNLKKRLGETRKILLDEGIDAEVHIYAGKPYEEIMEAARDYDGTCIVMGTTRKGTLKQFFSRSCSYRVAEAAAVPALVIP